MTLRTIEETAPSITTHKEHSREAGPPQFTVIPGENAYFAIEVATRLRLFDPAAVDERKESNFYASYQREGLQRADGPTIYVLPEDVWESLRSAERLYYRVLMTSSDRDDWSREDEWPDLESTGAEAGAPEFIDVAPGARGSRLEEAGVLDPTSARSRDEALWRRGNGQEARARRDAQAVETVEREEEGQPRHKVEDRVPKGRDLDQNKVKVLERYGLDGPIPARNDRATSGPKPDYPYATRFIQAKHYTKAAYTRNVRRIVIHITDSGNSLEGNIRYFQDPRDAAGKQIKVSAHYIISQTGEVVQMVRNNDVAYHAHAASADSIGIEHVANTRGLNPSAAQYAASAALVRWLCDQYAIDYDPVDRKRILGHAEADKKTTHKDCPNKVWNWTHYVALIEAGMSFAPRSGKVKAKDGSTAAY